MVNEIELTRGDTPTYQAIIKSNNTVFDLTDYTCNFTVKLNKEDKNEDALIGPIVGTITDAEAGKVEFSLSVLDSDVDEGIYFFDVEITKDSDVFTPINSKIRVSLDVKK